ncbi:MAG: ABC transporter ATP-binding protein [Limisphaerales bacterium]
MINSVAPSVSVSVPTPKKTTSDRSTSSLWSHLRLLATLFSARDKKQYLLLFGMMLVGACMEFVGIGLIPAFIALLASPDKLEIIPLVGDQLVEIGSESPMKLFWIGAGALMGVFAVKAVYFLGMYHFQYKMIARQRIGIAKRLFSTYMTAPLPFHLQNNSAQLMRKVMTETSELISGVLIPLMGVLLGGMMTVLLLLLLVVSLPFYCVLAFVVLGGVCGFMMNWFKKRLAVAGAKAKDGSRRSFQAVKEGLETVVDARILGNESLLIERFRTHISSFAFSDKLRMQTSASYPYALEAVVVIGILLVLRLLLGEGRSFADVMPQLALIGAVAMRLRQTSAMVFSGLGQMHFSKVLIPHLVDDIRELAPNVAAYDQREDRPCELMLFDREIRFEALSYCYPGVEEPALRDLDLVLKKGDSIAFVGSTGSGKSTLVNLLLGLLEPTRGQVKVDGRSIHPETHRWQRHIGYVPQDIHLLDDTVRRNIAFGVTDEEIDETRVLTALRRAQMEETITNLPGGLDTVVGERGARLSGGQQQRLGIARALYHQPTVLVMDEGTSALDSSTEASLVACLRELEGEVTMIFVAHRLSTIEHCSRICFLEHGRLLAADRHEVLLDAVPAYRAMLKLTEEPAAVVVP